MNKAMIALAAMAMSGAAVAGPSWTYADVGYTRASSGAQDSEGYNLRGSFGMDIWHASASYADGEIAGGKGSGGADVDGYQLRVGAHPAVNDTTDLVLELGYYDGAANFGFGPNTKADGYILGAGLRNMWTDALELNAGVDILSGDVGSAGFSKSDNTTVLVRAGGQYLFTDGVGVGVDVSNSNATGNLANFYLRWSF